MKRNNYYLLFFCIVIGCNTNQGGQEKIVYKDTTIVKNDLYKGIKDSIPDIKKDSINNIEMETAKKSTDLNSTVDGIKIIRLLSEGETIGIFNEIEIGDYGHFNIIKSNRDFESYYLVYVNDSIDKNFAYGKYNGRKVKVIWQRLEAYIEQSGNNVQVIDVVKKVELLK